MGVLAHSRAPRSRWRKAEEGKPQIVSKDNDGLDWCTRHESSIIGIPQEKINVGIYASDDSDDDW